MLDVVRGEVAAVTTSCFVHVHVCGDSFATIRVVVLYAFLDPTQVQQLFRFHLLVSGHLVHFRIPFGCLLSMGSIYKRLLVLSSTFYNFSSGMKNPTGVGLV